MRMLVLRKVGSLIDRLRIELLADPGETQDAGRPRDAPISLNGHEPMAFAGHERGHGLAPTVFVMTGLCTGHNGRMVPYQTVGHEQTGTGAGGVNTLVSGSGVQR